MVLTKIMDGSTSAIIDLHKLIKSHNPFDRSLVVRTHDVWEPKFPDVISINGHISDTVLQGIDQIQNGQRSVLGITIKAEKGLGKTHLISRLRHCLKMRGDNFFVYLSETDYTDLDRINSLFLESLAMSLKQKGSHEANQWQELATLLINQAYGSSYEVEYIAKQFPGALAKHPNLVDKLTDKICQIKPDVKDPYVVRAILWTLFDCSLFAINWLAGRDLSQSQANAMDLPVVREDNRESRALGIANQVLDLMGDYQTVVICFDEVEPKNSNAKGLTTPQVVALLAKDLYSKIKRGILIMAVFPQTWAHQIKAMPQAESVTDRIGEKVFDLKNLNSDDVVDLLSVWLNEFYSQARLTPPTSTYPFCESELRALGKERPIVRGVLKWCCENWKVPGSGNESSGDGSLHRVEVAFKEQLHALEGKVDTYLDNSNLVADALLLGFKSLQGNRVSSVQIQEIQSINVKGADKGYLNFKIVGNDSGKPCKIGISVLQESSARYVSAGLKRLIDYKKFNLTRGCLVRSKAVQHNTHGRQYLDTLLKDLGGEWVLLKGKDLQPLLAIAEIFRAYEDYEVTQEQVLDFIRQNKIAENNYLICEILSDPSGQIPHDAVDEDQLVTLSTPPNPLDLNDDLPELT